MQTRKPKHPLFDLLMARGHTMRWLSEQIGMSYHTVRAVRYGKRNPGFRFRARVAGAFSMPESMLFHSSHHEAA